MILKNLTVVFPSLAKARDYKGDKNFKWNVQCATQDPEIIAKLKEYEIRTKKWEDKEGELILKNNKPFTVFNLTLKETNYNGEKNSPPEVVDRFTKPLNPATLGVGSIINAAVLFWTKDEKKGVTLRKVQVIDLVHYEAPEEDEFEILGTAEEADAAFEAEDANAADDIY